MKLYTQLNFGGNCEAAFRFYEKHLGGKITMLMRVRDLPAGVPPPASGPDAVIHLRMDIGGVELIGPHVAPPHFYQSRYAPPICTSPWIRRPRQSASGPCCAMAAKWACRWPRRFSHRGLGRCATNSERSGRSSMNGRAAEHHQPEDNRHGGSVGSTDGHLPRSWMIDQS